MSWSKFDLIIAKSGPILELDSGSEKKLEFHAKRVTTSGNGTVSSIKIIKAKNSNEGTRDHVNFIESKCQSIDDAYE